nr:GATA transcription factor 16-like [Ipomoea batatas]
MVDLSDRGSESEDMSSQTPTPERETNTQIKTCADCGTTKTPLWRGGPAGPKSLCNACGIRSRKRRRALLGLNKDDKKSKKSAAGAAAVIGGGSNKNSSGSSSDSGSSSGRGSGGISPGAGGRRFLPFGREVALQKPRSQQARRKMGEVEKAAFLLMALSCGSVFA